MQQKMSSDYIAPITSPYAYGDLSSVSLQATDLKNGSLEASDARRSAAAFIGALSRFSADEYFKPVGSAYADEFDKVANYFSSAASRTKEIAQGLLEANKRARLEEELKWAKLMTNNALQQQNMQQSYYPQQGMPQQPYPQQVPYQQQQYVQAPPVQPQPQYNQQQYVQPQQARPVQQAPQPVQQYQQPQPVWEEETVATPSEALLDDILREIKVQNEVSFETNKLLEAFITQSTKENTEIINNLATLVSYCVPAQSDKNFVGEDEDGQNQTDISNEGV